MTRRLLWAALIFQTVVILLALHPWIAGDTDRYLLLADSLADGWYGTVSSSGPEPDVTRPPGYPLLIAFVTHVLSLPIVVLILLQAIAYLISIALTARFVRDRGYDDRIMLLLAAAYPFTLIYSVTIMAEAWAMLGLTLIAVAFATGCSIARFAFIGFTCGLIALMRSDLLLLPVLLTVLAVFSYRRVWLRSVVIPVAAFVTLLPYTIWNGVNHGLWLPAPAGSAVGTSLYLATWQRKLPLEDLNALYAEKVTANVAATDLDDEIRRTNASVGAPALLAPFNPINFPTAELQRRIPQVYGKLAVARIKADPGNYASHVLRNTWDLWNSRNYPAAVPNVAALGLSAISYLVFGLGICGALLAILQPANWIIPRAMLFIAAYPAAVHWLLHTEARYTAPSRPLLVMFAAASLVFFARRFALLGAREGSVSAESRLSQTREEATDQPSRAHRQRRLHAFRSKDEQVRTQ